MLADVKIFGKNFFDLFDFVSSNVILPIRGLGHRHRGRLDLIRKAFTDEMNKGYATEPWHGRIIFMFIKYLSPILILLILLNSLGVIKLA